jgi:hypothetical protein
MSSIDIMIHHIKPMNKTVPTLTLFIKNRKAIKIYAVLFLEFIFAIIFNSPEIC